MQIRKDLLRKLSWFLIKFSPKKAGLQKKTLCNKYLCLPATQVGKGSTYLYIMFRLLGLRPPLCVVVCHNPTRGPSANNFADKLFPAPEFTKSNSRR